MLPVLYVPYLRGIDMRITKEQLKKIINEEYQAIINEMESPTNIFMDFIKRGGCKKFHPTRGCHDDPVRAEQALTAYLDEMDKDLSDSQYKMVVNLIMKAK